MPIEIMNQLNTWKSKFGTRISQLAEVIEEQKASQDRPKDIHFEANKAFVLVQATGNSLTSVVKKIRTLVDSFYLEKHKDAFTPSEPNQDRTMCRESFRTMESNVEGQFGPVMTAMELLEKAGSMAAVDKALAMVTDAGDTVKAYNSTMLNKYLGRCLEVITPK